MEDTTTPSTTQKQVFDQVAEDKDNSVIKNSPWSSSEYSSPTDLWGDQRFNPLFLKIADYFDIDQKEYSKAQGKITAILDWASHETGSKDGADILLKIAEASKKIQSPAWGERRYAILYRYIKLAEKKIPVEKQINQLEKEKENIQKEMKAYEYGTS